MNINVSNKSGFLMGAFILSLPEGILRESHARAHHIYHSISQPVTLGPAGPEDTIVKRDTV
ncbi:MAG TPA: hypothetical protein DCM07_30100 [Planctomycetaceae bacterium]|nr:hypothetical protein [Gimesia sp.]HAH49018.1 hypothetical protein [Planctomycetaceae bacterium]HBL47984.1 hypothetical protein [Planctomycetaceae bacterium]